MAAVGDTIEVQGEQGTVSEILIFSTKIITSNNQVVYIPNGILSNGKIKNHSQLSTRRVDIEIITNYASDVTDIKNKIHLIINQHPLVLKEPKADVFINNFTESSIHFSARVWTENAHHMQVKSDILEHCKDLVSI